MIDWPYFTAAELAELTWTTPAYIRNLAVRGKWRRRRKGRQMTYSFEDAAPTIDAHAEERRKRLIGIRDQREQAREDHLYGYGQE